MIVEASKAPVGLPLRPRDMGHHGPVQFVKPAEDLPALPLEIPIMSAGLRQLGEVGIHQVCAVGDPSSGLHFQFHESERAIVENDNFDRAG